MSQVPFVTDKQIKDESYQLMLECLDWAKLNLVDGWNEEDRRSVGITLFIYLKEKLLNHPPKFVREREMATVKFSGHNEPEIRRGTDEHKPNPRASTR